MDDPDTKWRFGKPGWVDKSRCGEDGDCAAFHNQPGENCCVCCGCCRGCVWVCVRLC